MTKTFKDLKKASEDQSAFKSLKAYIRFDLGSHKKTRLKMAGVADSKTLLHNSVSKKHADRLAKELQKKAKALGPNASSRLHFVTILHSVIKPNIKDLTKAIESFEAAYEEAVAEGGFWSRGAIELELVNLTILEKIKGIRDDEARKLNVLNQLRELEDYSGLLMLADKSETQVLVHCHVIVDLGADPIKGREKLSKRMDAIKAWSRAPYQKKIDSLFKKNPIAKNLSKIAAYVTKGGNDQLRYNAGFGRDLGEDLEAKIWRAGMGRADKGAETVEDERGLTVLEVQQLDQLYSWLMSRRKDGRGYILYSTGR
jgi:hypothetical protein